MTPKRPEATRWTRDAAMSPVASPGIERAARGRFGCTPEFLPIGDPRARLTRPPHPGERLGRPRISDSLTTPIVQTATYTFQDTAELIEYQVRAAARSPTDRGGRHPPLAPPDPFRHGSTFAGRRGGGRGGSRCRPRSCGGRPRTPSGGRPGAVQAAGQAVPRDGLPGPAPAPRSNAGKSATVARTDPRRCGSTPAPAPQEGRHQSYEYGRYGNPTSKVVEEKIRLLEGAEDCMISASGMCAATTMLLALVPAGGHIVTTTDCYRRTRQFIQTMLPKMGITHTVIDPADYDGLERALVEHDVTLYFSESPTNPYLRCIDVPRVVELCHAHGAVVCVDSTFATPVNQQAIGLGADLVLHSATKYMAGHNDVIAGALAGRKDLVDEVRRLHWVLGGVVDAHAAYLLLRGLKTLDLRVERCNRSALRLARVLEAHPKISRVHYPGLESHPEHAIAKEQMMNGFGGVVSFEVAGEDPLWAAAKVIDSVRLPYIAPSLGGVESLIEQPTVVSYWDYGPEQRAELGIRDGLIRFSVGIENYADIEADILQALDQV